MYLSKLKIHGFKSFASPTDLHFDPGITAIVGPNGCGKSNVVDAIRWVIGEQRARVLRSDKMENVLFNGSSKRRPLGIAEVELTVQNTRGALPVEYSEITLGRRLYRSGESEYLLNGSSCRLRDIVDLFMDTGMGAGAYSVIELKMIEDILSDNALDRRRLFEEAAGITKYKLRRSQTLHKLDSTRADLARLRDVTEEIEKRVRTLKRQASAASRFNTIQDRVRTLETALVQIAHNRVVEQEEHIGGELRSLRDELAGCKAGTATEEASREVLRKQLLDQEQGLSADQQRLNTHMVAVSDLEADLRLEQERLRATNKERDHTRREEEEARDRGVEFEKAHSECLAALTDAHPAQEASDQLLLAAERERDKTQKAFEVQRQVVREMRIHERENSQKQAASLRSLDQITNRLGLLGQEEKRLKEQALSMQASEEETAARVHQAQSHKAAAGKALQAARHRLGEVEKKVGAVQEDMTRVAQQLQDLQQHHAAKKAERELLQGFLLSYVDFPDAVQYLSTTTSYQAKITTVSDILTCEERYRSALDAALDDLGASIVVRTEEELHQVVALLREEDKGRALFIVMERLHAYEVHCATEAVPGQLRLSDVVGVNGAVYAPLSRVLLQDIYVVESWEAEAMASAFSATQPVRYITEEGEWVDGRGIVHAGSASVKASPGAERMEHRSRFSSVMEELASLEPRIGDQETVLETLRTTLGEMPLDEVRSVVTAGVQALSDAERDATRVADAQEVLGRQRNEVQERLVSLARDAERDRASAGVLRAAVEQAKDGLEALHRQIEAAEQELRELETAHLSARDRHNDAKIAAHDASTTHAQLQRDLARIAEEIAVMAQRMQTRGARLEELQEVAKKAQQRIVQLEEKRDAERSRRSSLEEAVAEKEVALMQTRSDIDLLEGQLRKLRQKRDELVSTENRYAIREAELLTQREGLEISVREKLGVELAAGSIAIDDVDEEAAQEELEALQSKLGGMGNINALALEEYEAESERYEFMTTQCKDLGEAEEILLQTIEEINAIASERFAATYTTIRRSFQELFAELFGSGARADLILAEASDPLETPIDIMAKPQGKRPVHISQLSSGEKTLTAIALLFAIYLVKPSPFCFLDEVDAPLDDANIDRFMQLIRQFSDDTQFVLVTHNKRTMEMADRLYGVTMQERGVSHLVGVQFEEAMALVA